MVVYLKKFLNIVLGIISLAIIVIVSCCIFMLGLDYSNGLDLICISILGLILSFLLSFLFKKKKLYSVTLLLTAIIVFAICGYTGFKRYSIHRVVIDHTLEWNKELHEEIIPFYTNSIGHIFLKSEINLEPCYVVFDTGADYSTFHEKYNTSIAIDSFKIKSSQSRVKKMPIHQLKSFSIGEAMTFKALGYSVMLKKSWGDCGAFKGQDSVAGLLGNNVINNFVWDFDMVNRKVHITDVPFKDSIKKKEVLKLLRNNMGWNVRLKLNGKKIKAKFDSGSSSILTLTDSVSLDKTYSYPVVNAEKHLGIFSYLDCEGNQAKVDSSKTGKAIKEQRRVFGNLKIADTVFNNTYVIDRAKSSLLGVPLFWEYERVILDFQSKKVYLVNPVNKVNNYSLSNKSKAELSLTKYRAITQSGFYEMYYKKPIEIYAKSELNQDTLIFGFKKKVKVFASTDIDYASKTKNLTIDSIRGTGYIKNINSGDSIANSNLLLNVNKVFNKSSLMNKL